MLCSVAQRFIVSGGRWAGCLMPRLPLSSSIETRETASNKALGVYMMNELVHLVCIFFTYTYLFYA